MITAKCDGCGKELGKVPFILFEFFCHSNGKDTGQAFYAIMPGYVFKLRLVDEGKVNHLIACCDACIARLDNEFGEPKQA